MTDEWDEDWYDDDRELEDAEAACCPECGAAIYLMAERCPACGYWVSEADRAALWPGSSKPLWLKVTAVVVLVAFLVSVLGIAVAVF